MFSDKNPLFIYIAYANENNLFVRQTVNVKKRER